MRTEREIMQLYHKYEYLIEVTVNRHYRNKEYLSLHGLDKDDLMQYGRLGLYKACKEFDSRKGKTFRNFAISNIHWSIQNEMKRDSISTLTHKTNEVMDKISLDLMVKTSDEESTELYNFIEAPESGFSEVEMNFLLDKIGTSVSERVKEAIRLRMEGYTYSEVGKKMSISAQRVDQLFKENKEKIIKAIQ